MKSTIIGIDLAKNVFEVYVEDKEDSRHQTLSAVSKKDVAAAFSRTVRRHYVGMEACGGAHYWARELEKLVPLRFA